MGHSRDTLHGGIKDWLVRVDDNGDSLWTRIYAPHRQCDGSFNGAVQLPDGSFVLCGGIATDTSHGDFVLAKIDSIGDTLWFRTYGGPGTDCAYAVCVTCDSGFILTGQTSSFGAGSFDAWLVKTDSCGEMLWSRTFGGRNWDQANDAVTCPDGGFALTGMTCSPPSPGSTVYVVRTDSLGFAGVGDEPAPGCRFRPDPVTLLVQPTVVTNSRVMIHYSVRDAGPVEIGLYDIAGRKRAVLVSGYRSAGEYGEATTLPVGNGVAYMRITTPAGTATIKLVVAGP
jgi:hypothetical protein